jgi:hypothetical protein
LLKLPWREADHTSLFIVEVKNTSIPPIHFHDTALNQAQGFYLQLTVLHSFEEKFERF